MNKTNQVVTFSFLKEQHFQLHYHYMHINAKHKMCLVVNLLDDTLFPNHDIPKIKQQIISVSLSIELSNIALFLLLNDAFAQNIEAEFDNKQLMKLTVAKKIIKCIRLFLQINQRFFSGLFIYGI